jgi:modification methylase
VILSSTNIGDTILDPFFGSGTTGAVAKRLGRHWIGIELESRYISIARSRIDIISPDKIMQFAHSQENKKLKRIPFQAIVKAGYIHEGEVLSFGNDESIHACILPDGNIRYQEITGSIHQVGREIRNAPCNGWLAWYYINQKTGEREPIDFLRQKMRLDHESSGDCC